ncbi:hypothetical protein ACJX0J_026760, partial [Zea mays]
FLMNVFYHLLEQGATDLENFVKVHTSVYFAFIKIIIILVPVYHTYTIARF